MPEKLVIFSFYPEWDHENEVKNKSPALSWVGAGELYPMILRSSAIQFLKMLGQFWKMQGQVGTNWWM